MDLIVRFAINAFFIIILIWGIYHKINKNSEYLFTFIIFNLLIFFVSSLLSKSNINTGFAFGIFAIFSILRYRTEPLPIKEMTFMFISIVIAIINSTVTIDLTIFEIIFANVTILLASFIMEIKWLKNFRLYRTIVFEDIKLIHEDKKEELIKELEKRTGFNVLDVKVEKIDYLKDIATLKVHMV